MFTIKKLSGVVLVAAVLLMACNGADKSGKTTKKPLTLKGLYSYGPEMKSFTDCDEGREYWVADSAKNLELQYGNLGFEKPYTPVYIEVECYLVKSDTTTITGGYDSTMVVTKVLKLTKAIPDGPCN